MTSAIADSFEFPQTDTAPPPRMPRFCIFYLAADRAEAFRLKPPAKPPYMLRLADYEEGPEVAAESPYEVWRTLQQACRGAHPPRPLGVGDVVREGDTLLLCNYWGFDPAEWRDAEGAGPSAARGAKDARAAPPAA